MLAILVFCFSSTNALAENQESNTEKAESFNLVGYLILGFALIGWTFSCSSWAMLSFKSFENQKALMCPLIL